MKHIALSIILSFLTLSVFAQGQYAFPWMRTSRGAADLSMGGAATMAESNMAWASFSNAAMLPFCPAKSAFQLGYALQSPSKTNYMNAGLSFNVRNRVGISAGVSYGLDPAYGIIDENGAARGTFNPSTLMANLGLSWRFVKFLSIGINGRYAMQTLAKGYSSSVFAGDAFLMAKVSDFKVSAGVANIGMPLKDKAGNSYGLATSAKLSLMYDALFAAKHGVQVCADADYYLGGLFASVAPASSGLPMAVSGGVQYGFNNMIFVRAGGRYGFSSPMPSYASAGLGFKFKAFAIDAAYIFAGQGIANSFSLSLGFSF